MPQPISRFPKIKGSIWGGAVTMKERPLLATQVAIVISTWAETELRLANLLSAMLRSEKPIGMSMYLNLTGADARRALLDGAARKALSEDDYKLFLKMMKAIRPVRERRNEFAHGVWGFTFDMPNALLWVRPDHHIARDIAMHEARESGDYETLKRLATSLNPEIMVYRQADLVADVDRGRFANNCVWQFSDAVTKPQPESDEMRKKLLSSPLLRALDANQSR